MASEDRQLKNLANRAKADRKSVDRK